MKMSIKILATLAFLIVANSVSAQQKYPKGLYMSIDEIVNKAPSNHDEIEIVKRSNFDIAMNGGNDYELTSPTL